MVKGKGISYNCTEALIEYSTILPSVEIDEHLCRVHKDKKACDNIEDFGRKMVNDSIARVWQDCHIVHQQK